MIAKPLIVRLCLLGWCAFIGACTKPDSTNPKTPDIPADTSSLKFECSELPAEPVPFGWKDSLRSGEENVLQFMYNPANANEIIYMAAGDQAGSNKLYTYRLPQRERVFLGFCGPYAPSVNSKGWVVFSSVEQDVFKIKCNGDSLTQLTSNHVSHAPSWDYLGSSIYFYQSSFLNVGSQIIKIRPDGQFLSTNPIGIPYFACFKRSNKILYQRILNNQTTLVLRDMNTQTEQNLISGTYNPVSGLSDFCNPVMDNYDQYVYWENARGIMRCDLSNLQIDTVLKNCPTLKFSRPVFQIERPDECYLAVHTLKAQLPFVLLHRYFTIEYKIKTGELRSINLFP
jgi:hypothetical protein